MFSCWFLVPMEWLSPGKSEEAGASVSATKTGTKKIVNGETTSAKPKKELGGEARLQEQVDWKRWSLWGVLGLGVLVLGAMAWRLVKQLEASEGRKDEG